MDITIIKQEENTFVTLEGRIDSTNAALISSSVFLIADSSASATATVIAESSVN